MSDAASNEGAGEDANRRLHQIESEAEAARLRLQALQHDVMEAEQRLGALHAGEVVEANEQLVLAMVRAHTEAEIAAQTLKEVARAAEIDALTELPNRTLLMDRFAQAIANAKRRHDRLAVLYVDLNRFKEINDTHGHAVGDLVLKRAAQCMRSAVRESDTVSRHGGDEFLILLAEVSRLSDVVLVADKVLAALGAPISFGEHVLNMDASIGISIYPEDGDNPEGLIDCADAAMYHAKRERLNSPVFYGHALLPTQAGETTVMAAAQRTTHHATQHATTPLGHATAASDRRSCRRRWSDASIEQDAEKARQLQQAAERAQRIQTEFMAVLAHEQRNALGPIRNVAALLGRLPINEPLLPRMQAIIERQLVHMSRLVDDVLDISRVRTGKLRLECVPIDLIDIACQAVEACRPALSACGQHLVTALPESPLMLMGDPVRLAQIFSNLLDNASKYSSHGDTIELIITVDAGHAVIQVIDHGIGIAAEVLPSIFDLFVQDTQASGFKGDGLGIGLTVVRELVVAHGGTVTASSAGAGTGATFVVTLPLELADPP
jgi:diguanylate cyclase (GGDEF)-like protein